MSVGIKKSFLFLTALAVAVTSVAPFVYAADKIPPEISNVEITDITSTSTMIRWETDEETDSIVNYGINTSYGTVRNPFADKTEHVILLEDLIPLTQYFFRVISTDGGGNQAISGNYAFFTKGVKEVKGINIIEGEDQKAIVRQIATLLEQVTEITALEVVSQEVEETATAIAQKIEVIGEPRIEEIGTNYVIISWATNQRAGSMISLAEESDFDPGLEDPYTIRQGNPDERVFEHRVRVIGLEPATKYHFKASSRTSVGGVVESKDNTFTTKSILPEILDIRIRKVEENSATIEWTTSIPSSGEVEYTNTTTGIQESKGDPTFLSAHSLKLENLVFDTVYTAVIRAENEAGDELVSEPIIFKTTKDEFPPIISKVSNESTLFPGEDTKIQTIISWDTDEESLCQVFYQESLLPGADVTTLPEEEQFITEHVRVVTAFLPATVYKFWVECEDDTENRSRSEDFVLFTPEKEKNIIDIIIENFQATFGWVRQVGK